MDCREFLDRYSDYDDSLISTPEVERFRAHMVSCARCARYDRVLRKGRMLARQLPAPVAGAEFVPRLQRRLWQVRSERRAVTLGAPALAAALAAVTLLLVATTAVGLMARPEGWSAGEIVRLALAESASEVAAPAAERGPVRALPDLPGAGPRDPRAWTARRVDRAAASSYSPLVIGPPAYRVAGERSIPLTTTTSGRRTLD
jgi:hypothetical protein